MNNRSTIIAGVKKGGSYGYWVYLSAKTFGLSCAELLGFTAGALGWCMPTPEKLYAADDRRSNVPYF